MFVQKICPAKIDNLYEMLDTVKDCAFACKFTPPTIDRIILSTEEALVNIISYGYPHDKDGMIDITCESSTSKPGMRITIKDKGIPFNPIEHAPTKEDIAKKDHYADEGVGGYGIYFILEIMNSVEYHRVDDKNVLTLVKFLPEYT